MIFDEWFTDFGFLVWVVPESSLPAAEHLRTVFMKSKYISILLRQGAVGTFDGAAKDMDREGREKIIDILKSILHSISDGTGLFLMLSN